MTASYAAVLGRNPALSAAELATLARHASFDITKLGSYALELSGFDPLLAERLGGTTKLVELIGTAAAPEEAVGQLAGTVQSSSKVTFGVSVYGAGNAASLTKLLKKYLRSRGISARFVPSSGTLNTAQVKHNGLIGDGYEWCLFETAAGWRYGRTVWIPDFEGFSKRDYHKPRSDTKRGMLPPQLARTMVNIGTGGASDASVYDPFCGSGVVLMEAGLLGHELSGSDLSETAVADTKQNLDWLELTAQLTVADASAPLPFGGLDSIVTEGYLGALMQKDTSDSEIDTRHEEVSQLMTKFLQQAYASLKPGGTLVLTLPIWRTQNGTRRLGVVDQAPGLGYTVVSPLPANLDFPGVSNRHTLEVARPQQRVIHELCIFTRN